MAVRLFLYLPEMYWAWHCVRCGSVHCEWGRHSSFFPQKSNSIRAGSANHQLVYWVLGSYFYSKDQRPIFIRTKRWASPEELIHDNYNKHRLKSTLEYELIFQLELTATRIWIWKCPRKIDYLPILKNSQHFKEQFCKNTTTEKLIYAVL